MRDTFYMDWEHNGLSVMLKTTVDYYLDGQAIYWRLIIKAGRVLMTDITTCDCAHFLKLLNMYEPTD